MLARQPPACLLLLLPVCACVCADAPPFQTFVETGDRAVLFNGNNEYLHYQDTWYILGYKPDSYVVSMRGRALLVGC